MVTMVCNYDFHFYILIRTCFYTIFSGRILTGVVRKQKMQRTIIIRRDYLHFVKKYGRFEKRHNVSSYPISCIINGLDRLLRECSTIRKFE